MTQRLAIVAGLALLLGALLLTFLPTNSQDTKCGHWFNPEWDRAKSQALAEEYADIADEAAELANDEGIGAEASASAYQIASAYRRCDDSLGTRRNLSIGLLVAAGLVPAAIVFVGKARE